MKFETFYLYVFLLLQLLFAGVVTVRIQEAYQNEFAPKMMIFPGAFVMLFITKDFYVLLFLFCLLVTL